MSWHWLLVLSLALMALAAIREGQICGMSGGNDDRLSYTSTKNGIVWASGPQSSAYRNWPLCTPSYRRSQSLKGAHIKTPVLYVPTNPLTSKEKQLKGSQIQSQLFY